MAASQMKSTNGEGDGQVTHAAELLAKLEEANRLLEADEKSFNSLTSPYSPGHSRKGSISSCISSTSSNSHVSTQQSEDDSVIASGNLWEIWGKLVNDWDSAKKKPILIKKLVRKGIPHHFRGLGWQLLLNVHNSPAKDVYVEYLKKTSPSEKLIRRDIARTFPDHAFFKKKDGVGQESLFNVMKAYSLHDREVGYCQGSGFIVGLLLMQMPEEEAFAVLVKLMQDYRLRELFKPSMAELGLCMFKLECLVQDLLPELFKHFQSQNVHTSMYASSWFLTLYASTLPLSLACKCMDLFISEGMDMIFRVGVAILQTSHDELMTMDMEAMVNFFQKEIPVKYEQNSEKLFQTALQVRYSAKKMKKLEKEYTALKCKENEEQVELRRLRTENRLLRQRIDNLEKESASLADRLIQDQVIRAQEAEEMYALKNEISTTKQTLYDTNIKLEQADGLIGDIKQRTSSMASASSLDEDRAQTVIQGLQEELIALHLKEADTDSVIKALHCKIKELEDTNVQLQKAPCNDVQHLQEELIAVKLREAEANLSLKEMRQRVGELEHHWEKHIKIMNKDISPKDKGNKQELRSEVRHLQDEVMAVRLRDARSLSDLKEMKQKVMELETQNQICTNQIRRMDEENKMWKTQMKDFEDKERDFKNEIKDLLRKQDDFETKKKEELMMCRIKEAESAQAAAELQQQIADLEIQKEELLTVEQLDTKSGSQDLENRIFDLQDEVLQLKLSQTSPRNGNIIDDGDESDDESESEDEELDDTENLKMRLSQIFDAKTFNHLPTMLNGDDNNTHHSLGVDNSEKTISTCNHDLIAGGSEDMESDSSQNLNRVSSDWQKMENGQLDSDEIVSANINKNKQDGDMRKDSDTASSGENVQNKHEIYDVLVNKESRI